jgi:Ca2+-binding EF-hand superfamily protein
MKTCTIILAAAVLSLPLSGVAVAKAGKHHHAHEKFAEIDTNNDGKITRAEGLTHSNALFAKADKNADGALSAAEMKATMMERMSKRLDKRIAKRIERTDTNKDGVISNAEARTTEDARFELMDKNKDGLVELAEIKRKRGHHRHHKDMGAQKQ